MKRVKRENVIKAHEDKDEKVIAEPQVRKLARLPFLTMFYFSLQREVAATPVTSLEMAAYLGVEVRVVEAVFAYLEKQGLIKPFKEGIPAYFLVRELSQISMQDLLNLLIEYNVQMNEDVSHVPASDEESADVKYRKIYSDLTSEILQLFGQGAANDLPL